MTRAKFTPNDRGIQKWLSDNLGGTVQQHAEAMAADISATHGVQATAVYQVTDRPRAAVIVPNGKVLQSRDGALTRAAAARGLEVTGDVG